VFWKKSQKSNFRESLNDLYPRLWRYCLVLAANQEQAKDLAQAACLRAIEKEDLYTTDTALDRWLFRIAKNIWLNELRSAAVRGNGGMAPLDELELADNSENPERFTMNKEIVLGVLSLPEAQREIVALVYIEGYSYRETADLLEIPIGTVMSRLSAARHKLTKKFEHYRASSL